MDGFEKRDYPRYLASKKAIDSRSLNRLVWEKLARRLRETVQEGPVSVLEAGAGIGTMFERMVEWRLFTQAAYTAVDVSPENERAFRRRLSSWAIAKGFKTERRPDGGFSIETGNGAASIFYERADIAEFLHREEHERRWDLLAAHAFMDLVDAADLLPKFLSALTPEGSLYLSLNYDGETVFLPSMALDEEVLRLYHLSMDVRTANGKRFGRSQAGRRLFQDLHAAGLRVAAAGSSDWVVHASDGVYTEEEAYFLHFILSTISRELEGDPLIDQDGLKRWIQDRRAQVQSGELVYIAKQLDFLATPLSR